MRLYRFRIVNPPCELIALRELECSNDAAAATKARTLCDGHNVEVWQGSRWVTTVKDTRQTLAALYQLPAGTPEPHSGLVASAPHTTV